MQKIPYSAEGKPTVRATVDADGVAHAPDGYRFPNGYVTSDCSAPLIPLQYGYAIRYRDRLGIVREFLRWDDEHADRARAAAWRFWRKTGFETVLYRFPPTRVRGVYPWGNLETVQHWGARK